jgi:hypothetical protein
MNYAILFIAPGLAGEMRSDYNGQYFQKDGQWMAAGQEMPDAETLGGNDLHSALPHYFAKICPVAPVRLFFG